MSDLPDAKEWVERASQNAQGAADLLQARNWPLGVEADFGIGEDQMRARLTYLSNLWTAKYPTANPPRGPTWEDAESAMALANQFIEWAKVECGVDPKPSPSNGDPESTIAEGCAP